jgi:hypothetical protein
MHIFAYHLLFSPKYLGLNSLLPDLTVLPVQLVPEYEDFERERAGRQSRLLPPDSLLLNLGHNRELVTESAASLAPATALAKRDGRTGPIPVHRYRCIQRPGSLLKLPCSEQIPEQAP